MTVFILHIEYPEKITHNEVAKEIIQLLKSGQALVRSP